VRKVTGKATAPPPPQEGAALPDKIPEAKLPREAANGADDAPQLEVAREEEEEEDEDDEASDAEAEAEAPPIAAKTALAASPQAPELAFNPWLVAVAVATIVFVIVMAMAMR
jgi:hypothetical protein